MTTHDNPVLGAALDYLQVGFAVLPIRADGSKRPALPAWKDLQNRQPTEAELRQWFAREPLGLAVVCGSVSGNLACLDFDAYEVYEAFLNEADRLGLNDLLSRIPIAITPSDGRHLYFRTPEPLPTGVLARDETGQVLIEVRGTGSYAILPPSPASVHPVGVPYEWLRPDLRRAPTLTAEETEALLSLARSFNCQPEPAPRTKQERDEVHHLADTTPADIQRLLGRLNGVRQRNATEWVALCPAHDDHEPSLSIRLAEDGRILLHCFAGCDPEAVLRAVGLSWGDAFPAKSLGHNGHRQGVLNQSEPEKDYGHAVALAEELQGKLRWCVEWKTWLEWTGTHWQHIPLEAVKTLAVETLRGRYLRQMQNASTKEETERLSKRLLDIYSNTRIEGALELASGLPTFLTHAEEFDAEPETLNTPAGVIDLRTGRLKPHDPNDLCTRITRANYDPNATCPRWQEFLNRIFDGDADLISFVQRALGYALLGTNPEHLLFILHGTGWNGKSTLVNTIKDTLGSYAGVVPRDALLTRKHQQDAQRTAYAALEGVRFGVLDELSDEAVLSTTALKDLTSGNPMQVRALYQNYHEVRLQLTIFVSTNHKPSVNEHTTAVWRRIRLLPFEVTIPARERIPRFSEMLVKEEGAGILRWLVEGARAYLAHGLCEPQAVKEATAEYRREEDALSDFIDECCDLSPRALTPVGDLYRAYEQWCEANDVSEGERLTERTFGKLLTKRGFGLKKSAGIRYRRGIRLKKGVEGVWGVTSEKSHTRESNPTDFSETTPQTPQTPLQTAPVEGEPRTLNLYQQDSGSAVWVIHDPPACRGGAP